MKTEINGYNKLFLISILIGFFVFLLTPTTAQKLMAINEDLERGSCRFKINAKGIGPKYYFGDFEMIKSKAHYLNLKAKKGQIKNEYSYLIVGYETDTLNVDVSVTTISRFRTREWNIGNFSSSTTKLKYAIENIVATIEPSNDIVLWEVNLKFHFNNEMQEYCQFEGFITDGTRLIGIIPVRKWSDGESSFKNSIIGYEFYMEGSHLMNGSYMAAIQLLNLESLSNTFIWLRDDIPNELKLLFASAGMTILDLVKKQEYRIISNS